LFSLSLGSGGIDSLLASLYEGIRKTAMPAGLMTGTKEMIKQDLLSLFFVSIACLAITGFIIKNKMKSIFAACLMLAAVNFADVNRIDSKFITYEDYSRLIPAKNAVCEALLSSREPFRVANFDQLYGPNRNIYYGIQNLGGMHGLMPAAYKQLENTGSFGNININRQFNIRYYLNSEELNVPGFKKVLDTGSIKLFEDIYAKSRVFFSDKIVRVKTEQEEIDFLKSPSFTGYEIVAGMDYPEELPLAGDLPGGGNAVIREYMPGRVKATVNSSGGAVVLSEGYYKQWKAKVDNNSVKVYRVNFYSLGVMVPAGVHEVEFYYDKTGIYTGLFVALAAFIFYVFVLFKNKKAGK
jgi:uncharacterized membrane protein YfhO